MQKPAKEQLAWEGNPFFEYWFPVFCGLWALALLVTFLISWLAFAITAVAGGLFLILAIEPVPPAHAALVLRLGRRVVSGYFWVKKEEGVEQLERVLDDQAVLQDFNPNIPEIRREYFTKGEGLRIVFPLIEALRIFSLERREKTVDAEDTFIQGGIAVIPEMLYVWRISNLGRAIEFSVGKEGDIIAALTKGLDDAIISGGRTVFSLCSLEQAIMKTIPRKAVEEHVHIAQDEGAHDSQQQS